MRKLTDGWLENMNFAYGESEVYKMSILNPQFHLWNYDIKSQFHIVSKLIERIKTFSLLVKFALLVNIYCYSLNIRSIR
jgi:hypothetical protein